MVFTPDEQARGWSQESFDRLRLRPGAEGVITRIQDGQYLFLDDERGGFHWVFDARENLRSAILRNRIRVEEINLVLNRSGPTTSSNRGRRRLIDEKLHLEQCIAELQVELQSKDRHEAERLFRWEDLDQRIVSSKTMDIVEDMSERVRTAERKISFETARSGNSSGYVTRLLEFHEELTNEWAETHFNPQ